MDQSRPLPEDIYGVERWSRGLVTVTAEGEIALCDPAHPDAAPIPLPGILHDLDERGIAAPLLLRVSSFLEAEIRHLNQSFADAIARMNYKAPYRGVFPIKVNQQAQVIDRIVRVRQALSLRARGRVEAGTGDRAGASAVEGGADRLQRGEGCRVRAAGDPVAAAGLQHGDRAGKPQGGRDGHRGEPRAGRGAVAWRAGEADPEDRRQVAGKLGRPVGLRDEFGPVAAGGGPAARRGAAALPEAAALAPGQPGAGRDRRAAGRWPRRAGISWR